MLGSSRPFLLLDKFIHNIRAVCFALSLTAKHILFYKPDDTIFAIQAFRMFGYAMSIRLT